MLWFKSMVSFAVTDLWPWELGNIFNLCVNFLVDNVERVVTAPEPGRGCCLLERAHAWLAWLNVLGLRGLVQ